ncbi:heat-inducible transcription repressor HrcA [Catenovulum sp. SM1970]|uniref:heat-inducible transcriptional repressor HrcA n=1 Tax=Marinifaba aquimaris TaxID=2741323 RepID=UPI001574A083|nr:heat-inducible transcriptional repressor HrcA [Marinifaba aquimaris]NTS77561.1 heat-inducible transcription repressor HrcA [Marinifaba aquimaris]
MNDRAMQIMKLLVEEYLKQGQPISSKALANTLADHRQLTASPATIRNVMMNLEKSGLLASPHTSAGRVPTPTGLRFFVDELLTVKPFMHNITGYIKHQLSADLTPSQLCQHASKLLADMTSMAGIVTVPKLNQTKIEKIEFIRLTETRLICVLVMHDGDIQNRIIESHEPISNLALSQTTQLMNLAIIGKTLEQGIASIKELAMQTSPEVANLSKAALNLAITGEQEDLVLAGQNHLLDSSISEELDRLKQLIDAVTEKQSVMNLMQRCSDADGVKIFIGNESGLSDFADCSVVSAPYQADGQTVGRLAVIGSTRMDYTKVIPIVDITARLLTSALNQKD